MRALGGGRCSHALCRDLRIAGRLAIPRTLYKVLFDSLGGSRAARKFVSQYQKQVLDAVTDVLADCVPRRSTKPNPFDPDDWRTSARPV